MISGTVKALDEITSAQCYAIHRLATITMNGSLFPIAVLCKNLNFVPISEIREFFDAFGCKELCIALETVVHTNRIAVEIVDIDLVVDVVRFCHRRYKIFQRVFAIDNATGFAYTATKAMLINIGVLVLDISRFQLLGNRVHELCILATSHTMQIAILYIRLGDVLPLARHELSHYCVLNLLNGQAIMRRYLVRNTMSTRLHLICQTIWIHLDKRLADCLYNLVRIKFDFAPITLCNFQLLLPP